jgi:hypothetical protein
MDIEPNLSGESLRFREHYRTLTDDDLVHLAIDRDLIPAAREAISDELAARGLRDLSTFKKRFDEDAANAAEARNADLLPVFGPSRALMADGQNRQYFGFTCLVIIGLIGLHKWLLGDATTWRKEETLFLWLFFALIFIWDPIVEVFKGRASGKRVWWLVLGLTYIVVTAAELPPIFQTPRLGAMMISEVWDGKAKFHSGVQARGS